MPKMKRSSAHIARLAKLRKRKQRENPAYRQLVKERDAVRRSQQREKQKQTEDCAFTITNSEGIPIIKVKQSPAEVLYRARLRDKLRKQRLRKDPEYRLQENQRDMLRKRRQREDPAKRQLEKDRDTLRKRKLREDPAKRQLERERDTERRRRKRKAEWERKNAVSMRYYCVSK